MNRIDFTKPGGFPLDQDVLGFMQANTVLVQQAAALGGEFAILSGCAVSGVSVGNGYVVIKGEILPFVGSQVDEKVVIVETVNNLTYEDGSSHPSEITRYATFGDDGVTNYLWVNFKRNTPNGVLARLEAMEARAATLETTAAQLERVAAPFLGERGGMVLWNKPHHLIPTGWAEVLDWRGRMAIGCNPGDEPYNYVGKNGGSSYMVLQPHHIPRHSHHITGSNWTNNNGAGNVPASNRNPNNWDEDGGYTDDWGGNGSGGTDAFSLMNPYRTVVFIEYVGV